MFINNMVEDSSPNSLKKTKCIYDHKRAVVDHSYSDNLYEPFFYGEVDLNVKRLQKADRSKVMTIVHMIHWVYYLFAPIIMY